jgi:hypothetical protein
MLHKSAIAAVMGVVVLLGAHRTHAILVTEDFQVAGDPDVPGFDPIFNHQIGLDELGRPYSPHSRLDSGRFTSPGHSLFVGSGTDYVTFNLGSGEYVDYVGVWTTCYQDSPPAYFHVIGTEGDLLQQIPGGFMLPFVRFDTSAVNLGAITEIRLTGPEAYFDDLTINIVPEPGAICLFAMGGLLLTRRRSTSWATLGLAPLFLFSLAGELSAAPVYQPGESPASGSGSEYEQQSEPLSPPGSEIVDIVFVLDGSGSITDPSWELEKWGVANCFDGPNAFIPADGTVAIGVVRFEDMDPAIVGVPLTTIDSPATAAALAAQVKALSRDGWGTDLEPGLKKAVDVLRTGFGSERLIVVATDMSGEGTQGWLDLGRDIRRGEGYAAGLGPTRICTVFIRNDGPCAEPPEETPNTFLRKLANTLDAPAPQPYLDEPIGHFMCAYSPVLPPDPPDAQAIEDFVLLCNECSCSIIHAGEDDCNGNGVPDVCEYVDCQPNGVADVCDIFYGTSDDCNINGIPDECEPDCQPNGVADECDIANRTSHDWNYDGIPDECQLLGAAIYVDEDPAVPGPRDGTTWDRAYLTLQEGLADARANPEKVFVFVANGVYEPDDGTGQPGNRSMAFDLVNSFAIMGGFAGFGALDPFERLPQALEPVGHASVLSGDLSGNDAPGFVNNADNSYHVVTAGSTVTTSTIFDGFFIVGGNADSYEGGGGFRMTGASPRVFNCTITANSALNNGGGIAVENGSPELANLIVARNRTTNGDGAGSGIYCEGMSRVSIVNSTIVWNSSWNSGGLVADQAVLTNSILWGNTFVQIKPLYSPPTVSFCTVQDGWPGTRILRSNPAFADPDGADDNPDTWQDNDYHLSSNSPCIDVGANGAAHRPLQDFDLQNRVQECVVDRPENGTGSFFAGVLIIFSPARAACLADPSVCLPHPGRLPRPSARTAGILDEETVSG